MAAKNVLSRIEKGFLLSDSTLSDIAKIICPEITQSYHIFPVYRIENIDIFGTVCASHPVSRNFEIHYPDIPFK